LASGRDALEVALDVLPETVVLIDAGGVVSYANRRLAEDFGLEPAEVVGIGVGEVAAAAADRFADRRAYDELLRRFRAAPDRPHEQVLELKDGRVFLHRSWPILCDGSYAGRIVVMSDVTEREEQERRTRMLLASLVAAQEAERRRIAFDLHDGPVQELAAALLRLESLGSKLGQAGDGRLARRVEEIVADLRGAYEQARGLLFSLKPDVLEEEGLGAAVAELLVQLARTTGLETKIEDERRSRASLDLELIAFRVVHEALVNVRKHAGARSVVVRLRTKGGLRCEVADDGVGFDPAAARERLFGHLGLPSMRERVELAGGTFSLESSPGHGTTIRFALPGVRP